MASISPSTLASPPSTSIAATSSLTSPKRALISPRKHAKSRGFGRLKLRASPSDSSEGMHGEGPETRDRLKLAFAKASAYQKAKLSRPVAGESPEGEGVPPVGGGDSCSEGPDSVKLAMERAGELKKNGGVGAEAGGLAEGSDESEPAVPVEPLVVPGENGGSVVSEPVKLAMEGAREYKKDAGSVKESNADSEGSSGLGQAVPDSLKLCMERAREYKKNKGAAGGDGNIAEKQKTNTGLEKTKAGNPESMVVDNKVQKPGELKVSSLEFLGLDFSEKKNKGVPAGLVPVVDPYSDGDLPEVEIIVGDASKFESSAPSKLNLNEVDEDVGLYKPKVSTWGVFPRPSNISKAFGGGRNIRPGEVVESADVKVAKEEQTRQSIGSYKSKMGLSIDAKMKAECEKALKEGDHLMDIGKLREALPYYENIMKNLAFQTELHGIAALQWSICQDSLSRLDEARVMYEKLKSHPSVKVSKKARQFGFGFQAMEMMKVASSSTTKTTGYENYFDAFLEDKANYAQTAVEQDDNAAMQALPYLMFLVSPVLIVIVIAIRKSFKF